MGSSVHRGHNREPGCELVLPGTLGDRHRRALKTKHHSLWENEGNLKVGLLYWVH